MAIPLPLGLLVGMRIRTNERYARVHPQSPPQRYGTILGGSKGCDGPVIVQIEGIKHPRPLLMCLFEVFDDKKNAWLPAELANLLKINETA